MEELKTIKSFLKKYRLLDGQRRRLLEVSLFSFLSVGITMLLPRVTQKIVADAGLVFLQHLRLKFAFPVSRHRYLYISKAGPQCFITVPVATNSSVIPRKYLLKTWMLRMKLWYSQS